MVDVFSVDHLKRLMIMNIALLIVGLVISNPMASWTTVSLFIALTVGEEVERMQNGTK